MATRTMKTLAMWAVLTPALLLAAGCAASKKPPMADQAMAMPLSVTPGTRALAVDDSGRQWDVTILSAYYAASGRECMRVSIAQPTLQPQGSSVACANGGRWTLSPPLRNDDRTATAGLPTSFAFSP